MEFYRVNLSKAKREFQSKSIRGTLSSYNKEGMAYYKLIIGIQRLLDLDDIYLKHDYLSSRRMSDEQIEYLVSEEVLEKVELPGNESISISLKVKYRTEPEHAIKTKRQSTKNLEMAWKMTRERVSRKDPDYIKIRRECAKKVNKERVKIVRYRRRKLKNALIEEFSKLPERISAYDVGEVLEKEKYSGVLWHYPKDEGKLYMRLLLDLRAIGIDTNCRSERMIKEMENRLSNPKYKEFLLKRVEEMTETRNRLYEEYPELKIEADRKSAETRKRMMQEDEEFREMTLKNLKKGNPALWEKYRTDEDFRKKIYKIQIKNLRKGVRTKINRAKRRRDALKKWVIGSYFGGDPYAATPYSVEKVLISNPVKWITRHYVDVNLRISLKRDLNRLRGEYDEELSKLANDRITDSYT